MEAKQLGNAEYRRLSVLNFNSSRFFIPCGRPRRRWSRPEEVLESNATGQCPASPMTPALVFICRRHIAALKLTLAAKGKITKLDFIGFQQFTGGQAESWRVTFAHGSQMRTIYLARNSMAAGLFMPDK